MEITINTPALLFPAISLLMISYTTRFLHLANLIRHLHGLKASGPEQLVLKQIHNLRRRLLDPQHAGGRSYQPSFVRSGFSFRDRSGFRSIFFSTISCGTAFFRPRIILRCSPPAMAPSRNCASEQMDKSSQTTFEQCCL